MSNFKLLFLCSKVIRLTLLYFKVRWLIPCLLMYCRIHVSVVTIEINIRLCK